MLAVMDDVKTGKAGSILSMVAGVLLLLVWLAAMSLDDDGLCNSVPLSFGLAAVLVLAIAGMVLGRRPARPASTALFGLAAGLYFLIRCVTGEMLSEIWRELPLILAAFTFYGAGFLLAQRRGGAALTLALSLGVLANVAFMFLQREFSIPVELKGRPTMSLTGPNGTGCALLMYRNFAAMFLMIAGGVLVCRPFWSGWKGKSSFLAALIGMVGVVCSCLCGARSVVGLLPLMLVAAWVLWAILRLYSGKEAGYGLILSGLALFVGVGVLLGELFLGNELMRQLTEVDTHGRTELWAEICRLLPEVPWFGHGAGATPWQIIPVTRDYAFPNYAHNEYLQAWMDYGIVGVGLLVAVLLSHLAAGFWCLASEDVGRDRRALVAACMLLLISFAGCAVFDFVWHNVALVGLTAFACGVLASPIPNRGESLFSRRKWAAGYRPSLRPVRPAGRNVSALCCVGCLTLAVGCVFFGVRLLPGWVAQWEYNGLCRAGASAAQRAAFLEKVMPVYPDPELVDHYMELRVPGGGRAAQDRKEAMLRMALQANPRQLFSVVMLVDVLGRKGKYAEAEALMRDNFLPDGQPRSAFANWPAYYGLNLLAWGHQRMLLGDRARALSMMEYALKLYPHADAFRHNSARARAVQYSRNKTMAAYIAARRVDVKLLRTIGVEKDDSWRQPLRPGGSPSLYARWADMPDDAEPTERR